MRYHSEKGEATIALTGDSLITRRMSVYSEPSFLALVELLRSTDVTVTNAEMLFHDFESAPTLAPGGTYMRAHPRMLGELRWLGIDMVATANNHSYDYGENGLLTNLGHLEASGLVHAGIGRTMSEAREPRYLDTPGGRVAIISVTSTGPPQLYAGHQWRDGRGRPGANMIRYTSEYGVPEHVFAALREMRDELGLVARLRGGASHHRDHSWGMAARPDTDDNFYMGSLQNSWQYPIPDGCRVARSDRYRVGLTAEPSDVEENLQRIRDARRMADWVVVSMHNHEHGAHKELPAAFVVEFARAAIDAGADIFHGHGPHRDRGIEIYRGRPILYSLGHLVHQNATIEQVPRDNLRRQGLDPWEATPADFADRRWGREREGEWIGLAADEAAWRDTVAVVHFRGGRAATVVLHPIDLGFRVPRPQRGRPVLADAEVGAAVLADLRRLSAPYDTHIQVTDGLGVIDING